MTTRSTRFEKVDWLLDHCTTEFIEDCTFLTELVAWLEEDDFNAFHEHICRNWNIKSPFVETDEEEEETSEDPMDDDNYVGSPDHY